MKIVNYELPKVNGLGTFAIVYNGGSSIETEGNYGISHLVEHCMCDKIHDFEKQIKVLGLSWNAATTGNEVYFYLVGIVDNIRKIMNEFTSLIVDLDISEEAFEREKKIVLTEYNTYASDQDEAMYMNFLRKKYNIFTPGGRRKDIEKITYEEFKKFKEKWYSAPTYIGFSHPKNEKKLLESDLKEFASNSKHTDFNKIARWNTEYKQGSYDNEMEKNSTFKTQRAMLLSREFTSYETKDHKNYAFAKILSSLLSGGLASILMTEIRRKLGFVYNIRSSYTQINQTKFLFMITSSFETSKQDAVVKEVKKVLKDLTKYIKRKDYISTIKTLIATHERNEYIRYDFPIDDIDDKAIEFITKNEEKLEKSMKEFIDFVLELSLGSAEIFIDTDF